MLFSRKEKKVEELFSLHCEKVRDALGHLKDLLEAYLDLNKEFKETSLKVHQSENEADITKQQIEGLLYAGAFLPINRGDYILLAEFIDRIANQCEKTANLIVLTRPAIPEFVSSDLMELLDKGICAFESFRKAMDLSHQDSSELQAFAKEVSECESAGDRVQWEAIKKVFKSDLELAYKLHLRELIMDIGEIADLAEDASERLEIMVIKRPI